MGNDASVRFSSRSGTPRHTGPTAALLPFLVRLLQARLFFLRQELDRRSESRRDLSGWHVEFYQNLRPLEAQDGLPSTCHPTVIRNLSAKTEGRLLEQSRRFPQELLAGSVVKLLRDEDLGLSKVR